MRTERNERSRRDYKSPGRQGFSNRNRSRDISRDSSRDSLDRDIRNSKRANRSRNKSRNNSRDRSNDRARNGRNDSRQNQTGFVNIVIKMVTLGNIVGRCKPMLRKPEGLRRWMIEMMTH